MSGNTDKAAGIANEAAGKIKQGVGKAVGSDKLQGEGAAQELKGDAQKLTRKMRSATASIKLLTQQIRSFDMTGRS